ncbi:Hsp70 family protein [Actinomadura sp. 9N215]|uniref:Hsp70 family protein n=1 Tax=Actinomadura sp. 9N215 TaxID=3375150 RepID=UPI0037ADBEEB
MPGLGRRHNRRLRRLEAAFAKPSLTGREMEKAARDYVGALLEELEKDPPAASHTFGEYDERFPADTYASVFRPSDRELLARFASGQDMKVLTVVFEVATRLRLPAVQRTARDRLAELLAELGDANRMVTGLNRWQELGILERDVLAGALRAHMRKSPLGRDEQLWSAFFAQLPESSVPDLFAVHAFLGHGARAVRLAESPAERQEALRCCLRSSRIEDVRAGIELARGEGDANLAALQAHAAEHLFEAAEYAEALPLFRAAGRRERESECLERLGRLGEALDACPADRPDRLERLAGEVWPEIDALVERREFTDAVTRAHEVIECLDRAVEPPEALTRRRAELAARRKAIVTAGRLHFQAAVEDAAADDRNEACLRWSRFEEGAGDHAAAARQAENAGDLYRAHGLYLKADRLGEAERVLRGDTGGREARAAAREAGGDLVGAAELHAEAGDPERAIALYLRADRPAEAARLLIEWRGDDAIEDVRLIDCLRRSGDTDRLAGLCLRAVEVHGKGTAGFEELRRLTEDSLLPPRLEQQVRQRLESLSADDRAAFEERAAEWVAEARLDVDQRYARIWALDLGTTTSVAAIYDTVQGEPVLCPWKGHPYFASTLSLDEDGNERVGVGGEEMLASWVKGHISAAKRRIGGVTKYRMRGRVYRSEEVAARLIAHAREMVEDFLTERVLERVAELARAELAEVRTEWVTALRDGHDVRIERSQALLTIPAFFRNNQKQATRNACEIAGVELARLIHEPTAACIAATRQRRLTGEIVVVDLGAGTLDISALNVEDDVYDVHQVSGDTGFGGKDFDTAVATALVDRLVRDGIDVPAKGRDRLRLEIAAENLKIRLSTQREAEYPMPGFNGDPGFRLELSRDDLAGILAERLRGLRDTCESLRSALREEPDHLVLVGGPMLSPLVAGVVEDVFGLRRTVLADPRTAVATGAALQAAALSGVLKEHLLHDVTPIALGIKTSPEPGTEEFSTLIAANTKIPVSRNGMYTTTLDGQDAVRIEVFNGDLRPESKIGQFVLDIPPAPAGTPEIEVTFAIDASCVLEVTAIDKRSGGRKSVKLRDTTLLSPDDISVLAERRRAQLEREARLREAAELQDELSRLVEEAGRAQPEALFREFRARLGDHRATRARLDEATERVLAEIYGPAPTELETELLGLRAPMLDLAAAARSYLGREEADLAEGRHLRTLLDDHLARLRSGLAQVRLWNTVLTRLADSATDPRRRFRSRHATGDYVRALEARADLPDRLDDAEDVRRWLHCLAETGAAEEYRRALTGNADLLGAVVLDATRTEEFLPRLRSALVQIGTGGGFLISDRLVITDRRRLGGRAAEDVQVRTQTGTHTVGHIFTPESPHLSTVVLQLTAPVEEPPLRLGHAKLVRIGDRVYAAAHQSLLPGVVDAFESFPEQNLNVFRTGHTLPPDAAGGPLLNDLGEAVGVLTGPPSRPDVAFAITIDDLAPLLTGAGFDTTT